MDAHGRAGPEHVAICEKKGMRAEILPFLFRSMIVLIHVKYLEVCNRLLDYVHVRYVLSVVVHSAMALFAGSVIS